MEPRQEGEAPNMTEDGNTNAVPQIKYKCCDEYFIGDMTDTFQMDDDEYYHLRKHNINNQP